MNNATRFTLGLAALAALTACGGDGGGGAAPASVKSTLPADGSARVDIRPAMRIVLSASINAGSVTTTTVQLLSRGYPQRIAVSYDDASHTITVSPSTLSHDTAYTLVVSGLVDANGQPVAASRASFSTWINAELKGVAADGSTLLAFTLDANGRPVKGPDPDDPGASSYVTYAYLANGLLSDVTTWVLGSDLKTYVVDHVAHDAYDANGALQTITTPTTRDSFAYDAYGEQVLDTTVMAGADGTLGTSDDTSSYASTVYDTQGNVTMSVLGTQVGTDGLTIPASAVTSWVAHTLADADGPETYTDFSAPGRDGVWFTADDITDDYTQVTRDARGNVVQSVHYHVSSVTHVGGKVAIVDYTATSYDSHDNIVTRTTYTGPGADGVWFTADDVVGGVYTFDTTH